MLKRKNSIRKKYAKSRIKLSYIQTSGILHVNIVNQDFAAIRAGFSSVIGDEEPPFLGIPAIFFIVSKTIHYTFSFSTVKCGTNPLCDKDANQ